MLKVKNKHFKMKVYIQKLIFLFFNQNVCCGYSKELYHGGDSFEHPKHTLKLIDKKILTILFSSFFFI